MNALADLRTIFQLVATPIRGETHAERLESFYGAQAAGYDRFRERLLQGRRELCEKLPLNPGGVWVDLGGGTGANLEFAGDRLARLAKVYVVDLSPSLLDVAQGRVRERGWSNVECAAADATRYSPPVAADVVTFSYSLTMIPDWFLAMERAAAMLRPGGVIGVVDFYVGRKHASAGNRRQGWWTRTFWPTWFAMDNVFLSADHLPYLRSRFETVECVESRAKVPYLPLGRVPYYVYVGRKRA